MCVGGLIRQVGRYAYDNVILKSWMNDELMMHQAS